MVDEVIAPVVAPVVENAAPVADSAGVTAPAIAPVVEKPADAAVTEASPTAPIVAEKPVEKSLLDGEPTVEKPAEIKPADKAAEVKPADAEKPAEVKDEGKQSEEPAPLPTYDKFAIPENMTLDDTKVAEFTKELGEFETSTKADHAEVQKFGQKLMDKYITATQESFARLQEYQENQWEKIKTDWKDSFLKDPEIGGNRWETTLNFAKEFIRTHGGNEEQQKEFRTLMTSTGVGNHPAMIRMMANAMQANREGKPLPAQKPAPTVTSKVQRRYGGNA